MMDLQLGLSPPTNSYNASYDPNYHHHHHHLFTPLIPLNHNSSNLHKKRSFTQVLLHHHNTSDPLLPTTLSLLPLTPSHHDDECTSSIITKYVPTLSLLLHIYIYIHTRISMSYN